VEAPAAVAGTTNSLSLSRERNAEAGAGLPHGRGARVGQWSCAFRLYDSWNIYLRRSGAARPHRIRAESTKL
jgi:hypothetical protein